MVAGSSQPAVHQHDHPLGEPFDLAEHMRADDHRSPGGAELFEQGDEMDPLYRIGAVQRLVQHEHVGVGDERSGDLGALSHPLAEGVDRPVGDVEQVNRL